MLNHAASTLPAAPPRNEQWPKNSNSCSRHTEVPQTQSQGLHYGMWVHTSFSSTSSTQGQHCQNRLLLNLPLFTSIYTTGNSMSSVGRLKADPCGLGKGIRWQIWLRRDIPATGTCSQTHPVGTAGSPPIIGKKQCSTSSEWRQSRFMCVCAHA